MLRYRLKELRENKGLTQKEVAAKLHISPTAYGFYEQGRRDPNTESLNVLADLYDASVDYLLGLTNVKERSARVGGRNTVPVPVLRKIKAGKPLFTSGNIEGYLLVSPDEAADGEYFYLRVSDDSMNSARICAADLAYVRVQSTIEHGDLAVVTIGKEDAVIRRFVKTGEGAILQPETTNPAHVPVYIGPESSDLRIIGKVLHVRFNVGE